jgi:hypothetical protein
LLSAPQLEISPNIKPYVYTNSGIGTKSLVAMLGPGPAQSCSQGEAGVRKALFAYNPINWYANDVLFYANRYGGGTIPGDPNDCGTVGSTQRGMPPLTTDRVAKVLAWAKDHDGDTYRMGATGPIVWDCSSFTQAAYAHINIRMPRLAEYEENQPIVYPGDRQDRREGLSSRR